MSKTRVHLQISDGDANEAIDLEMRDAEVRVVRVLKKDEEGEEIRWRDADDDALTNIYVSRNTEWKCCRQQTNGTA